MAKLPWKHGPARWHGSGTTHSLDDATMAPVQTSRRRVTSAELSAWPDDGRRYELCDGEVQVVPAPLPRHQLAMLELQDRLRTYVSSHGAGAVRSRRRRSPLRRPVRPQRLDDHVRRPRHHRCGRDRARRDAATRLHGTRDHVALSRWPGDAIRVPGWRDLDRSATRAPWRQR
jgi:hypothetical protein